MAGYHVLAVFRKCCCPFIYTPKFMLHCKGEGYGNKRRLQKLCRAGVQGVLLGVRRILLSLWVNNLCLVVNVSTSLRCVLFLFLQRDIQSDKSDLCQASLQTLGHCLYQEQIARLVYSIRTVYYMYMCSYLLNVLCY